MQQQLWTSVGAALLVAVIAAFGERRRKRRANMDRIGLVSWPFVQMMALLAALILASLALHVTQ